MSACAQESNDYSQFSNWADATAVEALKATMQDLRPVSYSEGMARWKRRPTDKGPAEVVLDEFTSVLPR